MPKAKPENRIKPKYVDVQRDAMEDIKEGGMTYREPNRDRSLGEADRTGRHFDEDEQLQASEEHEAD